MLGFFGVVLLVIGAFALVGASTIVGQIGGLILWVIAAIFMVGQAVLNSLEREARAIGSALVIQNAPPAPLTTRLEPAAPAAPAMKKTLRSRFIAWWYS